NVCHWATLDDVPESLIPRAQYMSFALDQISADVVTDQCSGLFAPSLVTNHRRDKIEGNAHLRQHSRDCTPQVLSPELVDRQPGASRRKIVTDVSGCQRRPGLGRKQWSRRNGQEPCLNDLASHPDQRRDPRPLIFRARGG